MMSSSTSTWMGARNGFKSSGFPAGNFQHLCEQWFVEKLNEAQIKAALAALPLWLRWGDAIARTFQFKDFPAAVKFVNAVAVAAEQAWHHPDIDIRWNKVTLVLTTHDAGGLTDKDFDLARQFDQLFLR